MYGRQWGEYWSLHLRGKRVHWKKSEWLLTNSMKVTRGSKHKILTTKLNLYHKKYYVWDKSYKQIELSSEMLKDQYMCMKWLLITFSHNFAASLWELYTVYLAVIKKLLYANEFRWALSAGKLIWINFWPTELKMNVFV